MDHCILSGCAPSRRIILNIFIECFFCCSLSYFTYQEYYWSQTHEDEVLPEKSFHLITFCSSEIFLLLICFLFINWDPMYITGLLNYFISSFNFGSSFNSYFLKYQLHLAWIIFLKSIILTVSSRDFSSFLCLWEMLSGRTDFFDVTVFFGTY